jgi:hypothetical protein
MNEPYQLLLHRSGYRIAGMPLHSLPLYRKAALLQCDRIECVVIAEELRMIKGG